LNGPLRGELLERPETNVWRFSSSHLCEVLAAVSDYDDPIAERLVVVSEDLGGSMQLVPLASVPALRIAGLRAFAHRCAGVGLAAAVIVGVASLLTYALVRDVETVSTRSATRGRMIRAASITHQCLAIDCRHPI
jgi:hypothetical protein